MKLATKLKNLKTSNRLKEYVIEYILQDYKEDNEIKDFFSDLLKNGCQSGMISTLIYYDDTKRFYIKYMDEIHELIEELENDIGLIKVNGNRSNFYAWLAFEEMAREIASDLEITY